MNCHRHPAWMNVDEAASYCGIEPELLWEAHVKGRGPAAAVIQRGVGQRDLERFSARALDAWMTAHQPLPVPLSAEVLKAQSIICAMFSPGALAAYVMPHAPTRVYVQHEDVEAGSDEHAWECDTVEAAQAVCDYINAADYEITFRDPR